MGWDVVDTGLRRDAGGPPTLSDSSALAAPLAPRYRRHVTASRSYLIRPASPADAEAITAVHVDSITNLGAREYPPDQIALWQRHCAPQRYLDNMVRGERFFLAVTADALADPVGFSAYRVEGGRHRIATHVAVRGARRGVGTALYCAAEDVARECGAPEIYNRASLVAVEFYLSLGFVELGRGSHRVLDGELPCVFMRKTFISGSQPRACRTQR